jgi:hypothetical protein
MFLIILFLSVMPSTAFSEQSVSKTGSDYIAIGNSDHENKIKATEEACNRAKRELISYVFGATYQVNQNSLRSSGVVEYSEGISMNSRQVVLRGVVQEKDTGRCVIRYPIEEAELELKRLKSVKQLSTVQFTEIGNEGMMKGGVLEIVTIPDDVEVFIDGVRWGSTPLKLNQKLALGEHRLRLDHPQYQIVEETVEIGTLKRTRIEKVMKRATGKIRIETEPENALVKIDGETIGESPTRTIEVLAGNRFMVEATHPDTETTTQSVTMERDEERTLRIKLAIRPGYVNFRFVQSDLRVEIDGRTIEKPEDWNQIESGSHDLVVEKKGYLSHRESFTLRAGEKKSFTSIFLFAQEPVVEQPYSRTPSSIFEVEELSNAIYIGVGWGDLNLPGIKTVDSKYYLCCAGLDIAYQKKIFKWIGVKFKYEYVYGGVQDGDLYSAATSLSTSQDGVMYTNEINAHHVSIGIPIQFGPFYVMPEYGVSNMTVTQNELTASNSYGYSGSYGNKWGPEENQRYRRAFRGWEVGVESTFVSANKKDALNFYLNYGQRSFEASGNMKATEASHISAGFKFGY